MFHLLEQFGRKSGLKINISKSMALWFGKKKLMPICEEIKLAWPTEITILGLIINLEGIDGDKNISMGIKAMENIIKNGITENLHPLEKSQSLNP